MPEPLTIQLNGQPRSLPGLNSPIPLDALIAHLALQSDRIAVELNGQIAPRAAWPDTLVAHNARLEIVHFVGGGLL